MSDGYFPQAWKIFYLVGARFMAVSVRRAGKYVAIKNVSVRRFYQ